MSIGLLVKHPTLFLLISLSTGFQDQNRSLSSIHTYFNYANEHVIFATMLQSEEHI